MDWYKQDLGFFCKLAAELWPLIDVDWDFFAVLQFLCMKSAAAGPLSGPLTILDFFLLN